MGARNGADEFDLLEMFVDEMESRGENRNLVRLDVDEALADRFKQKSGKSITVESLQKLADKCLANEWLEHRVMGGKYHQLGLSTAGVGVVRSRQRKREILSNRSAMKKASDYIEEHKGLFVLLGVAVALAGVLARLFMWSE